MSWPKLSAISAVTPNPHIYLQLMPGTIKSPQVVRFVRHLVRFIPGPIFLFWDNIRTHRSRTTRDALHTYRKRLKVFPLPPYAPELNADEGVWAYLKGHALRGFCPPNLPALCAAIRREVKRIRIRPRLIRSFFHSCRLSF